MPLLHLRQLLGTLVVVLKNASKQPNHGCFWTLNRPCNGLEGSK